MIRIHYIEDNPVDQHALIREIDKKELPYDVRFSLSIAEARRKRETFDVILCDYYLPDGTILDLLPDLSQDGTPIVVLTGLADMNNAIAALKLGAKDYLVKDSARQYLSLLPIQIENLLRNREIDEERRWLSALFLSIAETIPFGLYLYEPESDRIVYHNDAFDTMWHVPKTQGTPFLKTHTDVCCLMDEAITGSSVREIFPPGHQVNSPYESEGEIQAFGDRTIKFFTLLVPCRYRNASCYVSIFNDISELCKVRESLYQYSRELEHANTTLDQRVRERTKQILELMEKKDEMIVSIGHDLRTPLTPLVALLPLLYEHELDPLKKNQLAILCEGARKIRALADAAFRVGYMGVKSHTGIRDEKATSCCLRKVADVILFSHLPAIDDKLLSVSNTIPDSILIHIIPFHLHQILDNLIRNAIQYTNSGGSITLHGGLDQDRIWFCVSDTGIGLTPDDSSRIFDEFYKVDSARNNLETHGLGLAEVKNLVLLNHGHITVRSQGPGYGSRFCVNLPGGFTPVDENDVVIPP